MKTFLVIFLCALASCVYAQKVGIGTNAPDSSAMLDVYSANKGFLMPRLTSAQRNAISKPAAGLLVFDTDKGTLMFFDGNTWRGLSFTDENNSPAQSYSP